MSAVLGEEQAMGARSADPGEQPFLKWAGGKRWIARAISSLFPSIDGTYYEPFLGSGAVFFALGPQQAAISDSNQDLIAAYTVLQSEPEALISALGALEPTAETYSEIRAQIPKNDLERAARTIYLNRTAFNGLWRVNRSGEFNVPFGCKAGTRVCDPERLKQCSRVLQGVEILTADFRDLLRHPNPGDAVYLDPPYTVSHNNNGFRRYNEQIFSWADQEALAEAANELAHKGCDLVVTNAVLDDIDALYDAKLFARCRVARPSRMAADVAHRRTTEEQLFVSRSIASRNDACISRLREHGLQARG
jgi:DNA adenine methylase